MTTQWSSSIKDCKVCWGISIQRWGRHYDHGAIVCTLKAKTKSDKSKSSKPRDFQALKESIHIRQEYEQHVADNIQQHTFDKNNPAESLSNLQNVLTDAVNSCVPNRKPSTLRKRAVGTETKKLIDERSKHFNKMSRTEQRATNKAISNSSRNDYRAYIDRILDDMAAAESVGNSREINRLVKVLGGKQNQTSPMPSKDLNGEPIVCSEKLLSEWNTFLTAKFAQPSIDISSQRETTVCPEDHLTDEELQTCLKGLSDGKAPGPDGLPIEAFKYSPTASAELFRIVKLIWDTEEVPPDIVKGVFIMLYKKKDRDDFKNY